MTSIAAISTALPEVELTNADLAHQNPAWRMEMLRELTGVASRRIAADDETAFDLSVRACESLSEQTDLDAIDGILYCTADPDHPLPGNAHLLHERLGLEDDVLALDYRLTCSGFVYGIAVADALAHRGLASEILLVTAETQSKRMHAGDRALRALLGDGAAVTHLSADRPGGRILASRLCSHGRGFQQAYIPAGGARIPAGEATRQEATDESGNVRTPEDMFMEGVGLWGFVGSVLPGHIEAFLAEHGLDIEDVDLYVFHQASRVILDSLAKALKIPPGKMFVHMEETGNLSSASIPFALRAALDQGAIPPGSRVLLSAFGAGISYGSAILEY